MAMFRNGAWLVGLVGLQLLQFTHGLKVSIPSGQEECFTSMLDEERIANGEAYDEEFLIRSGFLLANGRVLDGRILAPDGEVLWARRHLMKETEVQEALEKPKVGEYKLCFRCRSMASCYIDVAFFEITHKVDINKPIVAPRTSSTSGEEVAQHVHLQEVHNGVVRLKEIIRSLQGEARYIRKRLDRHLQTTVSSNGRTLWWTLAEMGVLVVVAGAQIFIYRYMFISSEAKRGF
mmetsp:Transcript_18781/g.52323  ORF Transcript_18781/g.52323 Transcript_18781/m.52323 type:complete len:234 (+) Transcript_18781:107-808(+)|eukprot:CAMPEP_0117673922 /NCGR_PEP_ID=MMETSP0804-20121206/14750_1 /TAXON_ID=1074897 /ORGANISM="Tetraselmis astigmatica, Strain CCMP880" /LENGTH=233 /DNA_ID=CAMNT_0005482731 /DNA_START=49 /DNA_END=750 /DNA_ORIENTATION=+